MMSPTDPPPPRFRIWIASFQDWQPSAWQDVPPRAVALEPAAGEALSAAEAQAFLEGFNGRMLAEHKRLWAVAVPVVIRFDGDAQPGESVTGHRF
jgi:hypothetical protein